MRLENWEYVDNKVDIAVDIEVDIDAFGANVTASHEE